MTGDSADQDTQASPDRAPPKGMVAGPDGIWRCFGKENEPDYAHYHDTEWGMPQDDDQRLFEKICLEGFQSGLSWLTVLRKRENFREAFDDFDYHRIANYTDEDVERLVTNAGIIR
ncbi:MAG: DNA-3-methyladenine glycosylase I, partial [Pseudomonadota bacterium]